MQYRLRIASLVSLHFLALVMTGCLLLLSSCKNSKVIRPLIKEKNTGEKDIIFSPVSHSEVKKIVCHHGGSTKRNKQKLLTHTQLKELRDIVRHKEAKLSDIPIPFNVDPIENFFEDTVVDNTVILGYHSKMLRENVCIFYRQEMERLGWRNITEFDGFETLLNFQKPGKFCSISIRTKTCPCDSQVSQEHVVIVIFVKRF